MSLDGLIMFNQQTDGEISSEHVGYQLLRSSLIGQLSAFYSHK